MLSCSPVGLGLAHSTILPQTQAQVPPQAFLSQTQAWSD